MDVYRSLEQINKVKDSILTIGTFDGLHRGHQKIINKVVTTACAIDVQSVVITFDPHPKQVLINHSTSYFDTLMSIDKKVKLLESMGVDITLVIPFDNEFSKTTADDFVNDIIINNFNPQNIFIGYDHHFGHNREGDGKFLHEYEKRGVFRVEIVGAVKDQNEIISSSRIRDLIRNGFVRRASFELGWVFGFNATVIHGAGRGHLLHFPTANFIPENPTQLLPKNGVYFARGLFKGKPYYGMCNLGYRPTFGEDNFVMEVHFFEDNENQLELYGETIEVQFLERIRDEKRFDSSEDLMRHLEKDKEYCISRMQIYSEEEECRLQEK